MLLQEKSGSWKSSLSDPILGLCQLNKGNILVDIINLNDIELDSWRNALGAVSQDTLLLNRSIKEKLSLDISNVTKRQIENA